MISITAHLLFDLSLIIQYFRRFSNCDFCDKSDMINFAFACRVIQTNAKLGTTGNLNFDSNCTTILAYKQYLIILVLTFNIVSMESWEEMLVLDQAVFHQDNAVSYQLLAV